MLKSFVLGTKKVFALGMNQNQIQKKKFWRKNMNSVGKFLNLQQPYQGHRAKSPQCKAVQSSASSRPSAHRDIVYDKGESELDRLLARHKTEQARVQRLGQLSNINWYNFILYNIFLYWMFSAEWVRNWLNAWFFRMLRNIFRASVITRRNFMLNRALLARGSNIKQEKRDKTQENDESTSSKQQTSSKTRFGWNDLYMRSHYDSDTKTKGEETKLRL